MSTRVKSPALTPSRQLNRSYAGLLQTQIAVLDEAIASLHHTRQALSLAMSVIHPAASSQS